MNKSIASVIDTPEGELKMKEILHSSGVKTYEMNVDRHDRHPSASTAAPKRKRIVSELNIRSHPQKLRRAIEEKIRSAQVNYIIRRAVEEASVQFAQHHTDNEEAKEANAEDELNATQAKTDAELERNNDSKEVATSKSDHPSAGKKTRTRSDASSLKQPPVTRRMIALQKANELAEEKETRPKSGRGRGRGRHTVKRGGRGRSGRVEDGGTPSKEDTPQREKSPAQQDTEPLQGVEDQTDERLPENSSIENKDDQPISTSNLLYTLPDPDPDQNEPVDYENTDDDERKTLETNDRLPETELQFPILANEDDQFSGVPIVPFDCLGEKTIDAAETQKKSEYDEKKISEFQALRAKSTLLTNDTTNTDHIKQKQQQAKKDDNDKS
jgi:hypothetical protein